MTPETALIVGGPQDGGFYEADAPKIPGYPIILCTPVSGRARRFLLHESVPLSSMTGRFGITEELSEAMFDPDNE